MMPLEEIAKRVSNKPAENRWTAKTTLKHFSIITWAVDPAQLKALIPDRFKAFTINNATPQALVSAVTFIDQDFHFPKSFPFCKYQFPQTNYRAYVTDQTTGEQCVWFFGTSLGSNWVTIPKKLWQMPWFKASYKSDILYKERYEHYKILIHSTGANGHINIYEHITPQFSTVGFTSPEEARLILTHPVTGYFRRKDQRIGCYKIWHPEMHIRTGTCEDVYFEKFEKLGLLSKEEMQNPYSVLLTNKIDFIIDLPPKK